ncbi:TldD/PmbA family protein, partial [Bacteroidales bacterium OttesenSCG-928-J16]|nr:TldD/PmbA family protein [Bacteroidales bacterium OttesenSCG-928-J16]
AQNAMQYALQNGCQNCRVVVYAGRNSSFNFRDLMLEKLQQASETSMNIELFVDGRYGQYGTNRLHKEEIEKFIKQGIESTRFLEKDEFRSLPDISLCYRGGAPNLQLYDKNIDNLSPDEKLAIAKSNVEEIYETDERIISINGGFSDGNSFGYMIQSNGFEAERASTWCSVSSGVSMRGEGDARPSEGWGESALYFDELKKTGLGKIAFERCLRKLGQKKIESGRYTMIVDFLNASRLLSPMLSALYGSSIQQKNSFLMNMMGEKVGSEKLHLIDNPHLIKTPGARYYDYEGVATKKRTIFENGVLKTFFLDTYYANKLEMPQTISGPSTLIFELGSKNLEQLIQSQQKAILVTGFNGGNHNSTTGNFSYGIEGFLIENGKTTQAINEMNITGNMIELWKNLLEAGNDPRLTSSYRIPSLVFGDVNFSGI